MNSQNKSIKTFLAGGVAGCCAKFIVAPVDRVKILLQAHSETYKHLGVYSTAKSVCKQEGVRSLFSGNTAQMLRIFPYAAIQFTSYEHYKKFAKAMDLPPHTDKLVAGSLAGMTAVLFTYPLDIVRARLAFQSSAAVSHRTHYSGLLNTISTICRTEGGVVALYRGIVPTMMGMAPYAGLSFYGYECLKTLCEEAFPNILCKPRPGKPNELILTIPAKLMCGGFAGAIAQTVSYPLDVARRKMQLSVMLPESHKFNTLYTTLNVVVQEHGIKRGLYRGISLNYIKVTPMVAVSFAIYELMKQQLGLDSLEAR